MVYVVIRRKAKMNEFELKVFHQPAGDDLLSLSKTK
jgi:hypothetical protein